MKTDAQLRQDVLDELKWDPIVQACAIGAEAKDGIVTLAGQVDTFAQKDAAERAAQRVVGTRGIVVEVIVAPTGSARRKDADLAQAAMHALDWNAAVPKDAITVVVDNGWLTLSGEVDWAYQRAAAVGAVRNLVGVTGIDNRIALHPHPIEPGNVRERITSALHRQAQLDANSINIDVEDDTVTLSGVVDSWSERMAVRNAAWSARGVQQVIDNLSVAESAHT